RLRARGGQTQEVLDALLHEDPADGGQPIHFGRPAARRLGGVGLQHREGGGAEGLLRQPKIPPGVPAFTVVTDEVTGPTDGQEVKLRVALKQKTKRDDVYPALHFLYRYAMTRNTFEPVGFVGEFYTTEGEAQTGGGNFAAKVWRDRSDKGPKCENAIK